MKLIKKRLLASRPRRRDGQERRESHASGQLTYTTTRRPKSDAAEAPEDIDPGSLLSPRTRDVCTENQFLDAVGRMPADNMFPGLALPGQTADQVLIGNASPDKLMSAATATTFEEDLAAAISKPSQSEPLTPEWADKAAEELNEKPETGKTVLVKAETHLHVRTDDAFLLRFLRARKFNCAKAFHMLQRYYIMKLRCPELFKVPRPSEKKHILEMQAQNMLEDRDSGGRRVYIFRVEKCDAASVSIEDIFRTNVLALEHIVQEPETQIAGLTVIVDMNGFGFQHAKFVGFQFNRPEKELFFVVFLQETFPLRFKGFHVINQPFYFDAVFAVLKPFLKDKIRRRIYLHGRDLNSLHAFISPEILPAEYGGSKPSFDNKAWRMSLLENEDKFVELETYGYKDELPVEEVGSVQ
ncbi:hypothetical protein C0J52_14560 [Blattella germanica]|nr:hypothetical protein C0J52_14560 [Blattella germanica]